ncbi:MAG TPA: FtsX-like permease family protein, partial [Parapedobacter sp.]|nr:FtsX-like permease family protein [Parapedobacter sp.]
TVVGVVKDFVYNNAYTAAEPMFFYPFTSTQGVVNIRTKAGVDLSQTVREIEKIIKASNPGYPFEYTFLDDQFNDKFKSEMLIQKLAGIFAVLSMVISCLGLFGLAAFTAERRTKEMGIRKVLGASISSLVGLLNREFVMLVLVACAVAFPIAWWVMSDWLGSYQYRTELHWWVFTLAGAGALLIALLTVSSQAIKAAVMNPTKSLRDE